MQVLTSYINKTHGAKKLCYVFCGRLPRMSLFVLSSTTSMKAGAAYININYLVKHAM